MEARSVYPMTELLQLLNCCRRPGDGPWTGAQGSRAREQHSPALGSSTYVENTRQQSHADKPGVTWWRDSKAQEMQDAVLDGRTDPPAQTPQLGHLRNGCQLARCRICFTAGRALRVRAVDGTAEEGPVLACVREWARQGYSMAGCAMPAVSLFEVELGQRQPQSIFATPLGGSAAQKGPEAWDRRR